MNLNQARLQSEVAASAAQAGFVLAPDAMKPLSRIDFVKLVAIHDHEERFLRTTFIETLIGLKRGQPFGGAITADDVETAILMLGTAAARQADPTLSKQTKSVIKDACGFC